MSGFKRFLVMHLDKVLLGVLGVWALVMILRSIMDLSARPKVVDEVQAAVVDGRKTNPAPPETRKFALADRYALARGWRLAEGAPSRGVFFKVESLKGFHDETSRYDALRKNHACQRLAINEAEEICLFPGCQSGVTVPDNDRIGACVKVQCTESTATTVTLEWQGPEDCSRQVAVQYCLVERRKSAEKQGGEDGWVDVMDHKGEPVKVFGGEAAARPADAADAPPEAAPKAGANGFVMPDAGTPKVAPGAGEPGGAARPASPPPPVKTGAAPHGKVESADQAKAREIVRKSGKPAKDLVSLLAKDTEAGRDLAKQLRNLGLPEAQARVALEAVAAEDEAVVQVQKRFQLVDFNLDTHTAYEYRICAVGTHPKAGLKKGAWTEPFKVKTKEDRGMRFVSYAPSPVPGAPNYVTVRVSKLYEPPWLEGKLKRKHFLHMDHAMIQPGVEKANLVGRMMAQHKIVDAQGNPVLFNSMTQSFQYVGDAAGTKPPVQPPQGSTTIRYYKADVDFSTNWLADKVDQRVTKKKVEEKSMNDKGQLEVRQVDKDQFRYFLVLKDAADPKMTMELELERKDYDLPLIPR